MILKVEEIAYSTHDLLVNVLIDLELDDLEARDVSALCIQIAQQSQNVLDYERDARVLFEQRGLEQSIQKKLNKP